MADQFVSYEVAEQACIDGKRIARKSWGERLWIQFLPRHLVAAHNVATSVFRYLPVATAHVVVQGYFVQVNVEDPVSPVLFYNVNLGLAEKRATDWVIL